MWDVEDVFGEKVVTGESLADIRVAFNFYARVGGTKLRWEYIHFGGEYAVIDVRTDRVIARVRPNG